MQKIMHVITGLRQGGAEGVLTRLVCATQSEFEHVVVSLGEEAYYGPVLQAAGIPVYTVEIGERRNAGAGLLYLVRLMRRERPVIVQTWLYHADVLGGLAARLAGIRRVLWGIRNTNLEALAISRATRAVAWLAARLSPFVPAMIVYNSAESRSVHRKFGYRDRGASVIENGYELEKYRPDPAARSTIRAQLGVTPGDYLVGCVARWDPQKDHANLLAALGPVTLQRSNVRVVLVGTGMDADNEALAVLIRNAGLQGRVILTGPRNDIPAVMNALDVHVLSSLGEAFPNVVAEAMACGTPCVVTDVGDAAHITGETGWVVPPRNSHALAAAIEAAISTLDRQSREALSAACRNRIVQHFGMRRMTDAYGALWRQLSEHMQ